MTRAVRRLGGCAVGGAAAIVLTAQPLSRLAAQSARWRPEERVLLSDFSYVTAIAASPFAVFAATTHGLTIYDRRTRAWRLPVTSLDGYPAARVRVALADVVDDAVWLGTDDGWARYDADVRQWEHGFVAGGVSGLLLDARDQASGVFVRSPGGWGFLPRGGLVPISGRPLPPPGQRLQPLDPQAALNQAPMADALRALLLTDPRLHAHRFTAAARSPDQNDLFFGTDGMGVIRVDATTAEWERLAFGLVAPRAGAVVPAPGGGSRPGVWVAAAARPGERGGLTWVAADVTADTAVEGLGTLGFGCLDGRRLLAGEGTLWLACERGLVKIDVGSWRSRAFDLNALALAPAPDGVWVGTEHGLFVVTYTDRVVRVGTLSQPVLSLLAVRESVWVGSAGGLGLLVPGATDVVVPPDVGTEPALHADILALARAGDTLVAATADQLAWRDPVTRAWTLRRSGDVGRVTAAAADPGGGGGVWLGGTGGVALWEPGPGRFHVLHVPGDVPAPVRGLAVDPAYLWVATDSGLVRFARDAARGR